MSCPRRGLSPRLEENSLQDSTEKYAFFSTDWPFRFDDSCHVLMIYMCVCVRTAERHWSC